MKTFDEYVIDWFQEYLSDHGEIEDFTLTVFNAIITEREENESLEDFLGEGMTPLDYLLEMDAESIYSKFFGYDAMRDLSMTLPDLPSTSDFLEDMLKQCKECFNREYDFFDEFIEDMASEAEGYSNPSGFFKDLQYGGCSSGMVGMLIYNTDCLEIYGRYANEMEEFREELEEEMGDRIVHSGSTYHYVWICWLCYEELAYRIAGILFPNDF